MIKILISLLFSVNALGVAYINKTQTLPKGGLEFGSFNSLYIPTSFVTFNGENTSFEAGEAYQTINSKFLINYGFTDRLQISGGVNFRLTQSQGIFETEEKTLSAAGLESILLSIMYSFPVDKKMQYSLIANYKSRTFSNEYKAFSDLEENPEKTALGDDGTDVSIGLGFTFITNSQNFFSGKVLYRNPGTTLSNEVFSELEFSFAWQYFALIFGVENIYSLNADAYTDDEINKPQLPRGSHPDFNSINRAWTAPYIGMNIGLGDLWRVELQAKSKISGSSTTLGNEVSFHLVRRKASKNEFTQKDAAFKEYRSEGVVTKVSKSKRAVTIDMGLEQGVEKGSKIDFYVFDYLEGNQLVASGYAVKVGSSKAVVKITKKYSKDKLKSGIIARAGLIK